MGGNLGINQSSMGPERTAKICAEKPWQCIQKYIFGVPPTKSITKNEKVGDMNAKAKT